MCVQADLDLVNIVWFDNLMRLFFTNSNIDFYNYDMFQDMYSPVKKFSVEYFIGGLDVKKVLLDTIDGFYIEI
jgi:hypothetical protein